MIECIQRLIGEVASSNVGLLLLLLGPFKNVGALDESLS